MWRKVAAFLATFTFAFGILFISILRTASVKYEFAEVGSKPSDKAQVLGKEVSINYHLAFPGKVLPDSILWPIKALRDRAWLALTTNPSRKAELKLLFADKRLGASKILFEKGKAEIGFSTLTKAEKYLEEASMIEVVNRKKGIDTSEFLERAVYASLKHFELMEEILEIAPEDCRPKIIEVQAYPKKVYSASRDALYEKGKKPPENPFTW